VNNGRDVREHFRRPGVVLIDHDQHHLRRLGPATGGTGAYLSVQGGGLASGIRRTSLDGAVDLVLDLAASGLMGIDHLAS